MGVDLQSITSSVMYGCNYTENAVLSLSCAVTVTILHLFEYIAYFKGVLHDDM